MNVLLTGGAGYIGSHTAVEIMRAGHGVVIADDLSNASEKVIERIEKLGGKKVYFYKIDVCDKAALDGVFALHDISAVVHFAGKKAVGESVAQPLMYYRNNLDATITLLEVMQKHSVNRLIFSSSATVYGIPKTVPVDENAPRGCNNPYGWTKYMSEQIMRDACEANKDLAVVLLRYFNPIGAHESGVIGEDPEGIPNNLMPFIAQVAVGRREMLGVFGDDYPTHDGTGVRDYIHVVDLAQGHVAALDYTENNSGALAVNLGTGRGYSVLDIVKTFERVNGIEIPYKIMPRRVGDAAVIYADSSFAKTVLNWEAKRNLEDMCRDTWNWQKNNPNGYRS